LSAKEIINLLNGNLYSKTEEQPQQQTPQEEPKTVYKSRSGGVVDDQNQPVLLYDKDGKPLKLSQIERESYVGHTV